MVAAERVIAWEEPPPANHGRGPSHEPLAAALRAKPGEWAHVLTYDTSATSAMTAGHIRRGVGVAWRPAGAYEAASRKVNGENRVYARYVGEEEPDA